MTTGSAACTRRMQVELKALVAAIGAGELRWAALSTSDVADAWRFRVDAFDEDLEARDQAGLLLSNRNALLEIDYAMRSGVSWRQLRPRTKKVTYKCVQKRFSIWVHLGVFEAIWTALLNEYACCQMANNPRWFKNLRRIWRRGSEAACTWTARK